MNKLFYPKLAAINIKKNSKTYIPYILTCIGTIMMFYIMDALSISKSLMQIIDSGSLRFVLVLGNFVIALFSFIFLLYTNSFLIKRRKKEFGLFNILGMEKKHLSRVILFETLYVAIISLVIGILGGILFSKLLYLVLLKILNLKVTSGFDIPVPAIIATLVLFGIIFFITLLNNLRQIHLAKPVELLKGSKAGEKEPKTKWLLTIFGLICLISGYYIALTTVNPLAAFLLFFVAVILVIIGTYCLFTAGSIALLKILKKKKKFYYKSKHFISVSGMLYRMKQNAVGLANICILSTMVLVMLSTTVSLYIGMDDVLRTRYPRNIMLISKDCSDEAHVKEQSVIDSVLKKHNLAAKNQFDYRSFDFSALESKDQFITNQTKANEYGNIRSLHFIPLEDYNRMAETTISLNNNEILLYSNRDAYTNNTLSVFNKTFTIKQQLNSFVGNGFAAANVFSSHYIIVKDMNIINDLKNAQGNIEEKYRSTPERVAGFDMDANTKQSKVIYAEIQKALKETSFDGSIESMEDSRQDFYSLYGGLFFIGIFLGALFIMATVLIIYYKQISEGFDDKERFEIMQKVGMSREEVKRSIHSQVLTVFFLPLVVAVIHIAFAFKFITKLLAILNLTNVLLFAICTGVTILIFAVFYAIVYAVTARTYYKIVS